MKRYNAVCAGVYDNSVMVEEHDGDWAWYEDVEELQSNCAEMQSKCAELQSKYAELLETATNALLWWDGGNRISPKPSDVIGKLRAAIAKAEGGSHE